jgi:multiple sugar transport system permease protein
MVTEPLLFQSRSANWMGTVGGAIRARLATLGWSAVMWLVVAIMIGPVAWAVLTSFKPDSETMAYPPTILPAHPTLSNYSELFKLMPFGNFFLNSLTVSAATAALTVIVATPAAYAMVRFPLFGSDALGFLGLIAYMIPAIVIVVPVFRVAYNLGALDSVPDLAILYTVLFLPFAVWQLRSYFVGLPEDLEGSAMLDGATRLEAFFLVVLPMATPGIIAGAIFIFSMSWSEYLFASLLLYSPTHQTLSPGLSVALIGSIQLYSWGVLMAGSTLMTAPLLAVAFVQRQLVSGLAAGATQG